MFGIFFCLTFITQIFIGAERPGTPYHSPRPATVVPLSGRIIILYFIVTVAII